MMRQRIVNINSDGKPNDTVLSLEDGTVLDNVRYVRWELGVGDGVSQVEVEIIGTGIHALKGVLQSLTFTCQFCSYSEEHHCDQGTSVSGRRSDGSASGDKD